MYFVQENHNPFSRESDKIISNLLCLGLTSSPIEVVVGQKIQLLLKNIDGIESLISNEHQHPLSQTETILKASFFWPKNTRYLFIANQVSRLTAFYYRTSTPEKKWNPLLISRADFLRINKDAISWHDAKAFPSQRTLLQWLLTK